MFRKSSSEKTIQGLEKGMNLHFYSHLQKNPQLFEATFGYPMYVLDSNGNIIIDIKYVLHML